MDARLKAMSLVLLTSFSLQAVAVPYAHANDPKPKRKPDPAWTKLKEQLITDLAAGGISVAAALSGNVPLALSAGILTKYVTSYGIAGVKSLIDLFKGHPPEDLGELNLAFIYLVQTKRLVFESLIRIRQMAESRRSPGESSLAKQLDELQSFVTNLCAEGKCEPVALDKNAVNLAFVDISLSSRSTVNVSQLLNTNQIKNTYHYLILLYLDLMYVEQQLLQSQANVLATQVSRVKAILHSNPFLSNEEKEYQYQMTMNMAIRWQLLADRRRVLLSRVFKKSIHDLAEEERRLSQEIERLRESSQEDGQEEQR